MAIRAGAARFPGRRRPTALPFAVITHEIKPRSSACSSHPEVVHTLEGAQLLKNFVHKIAGCAGDWTMANFEKK